ncbi:putative bis(5'-nucleosyl)-tetraphosphatase (symmetrical) [Bacteriovorax sp. BSW11_IV]|uniref:metallophosphoesterase n=1 Tax=Bacteriovorax sp. BSW11_IV TaxID=1353529 RepID=UPI00038A033F|nr:metallophosphoesterase [Bacteriovorax sp. BSW11_IV]EQC49136.1 putative bis(5'-nucleosyl)-tetraphosphatase (symmetrical) [Bacteriovorax sp. BSW11_IV]
MDFIVGDIHGCFDEFMALREKCQEHAGKNKIRMVSCGDLIDRGPKSFEVVEHFATHGEDIALLGNHEQEFLVISHHFAPWNFDHVKKYPIWFHSLAESYKSGEFSVEFPTLEDYAQSHIVNWTMQGGSQTLKSFEVDPLDPTTWYFDKTLIDYMLSLPLYLEEDEYFLSHALVTQHSFPHLKNGKIIDVEDIDHIFDIVDELLWNRDQEDLFIHPTKIMVSGHTPFQEGANWMHEKKILQVDTGCVYGGPLTAWSASDNTLLIQPSLQKSTAN